MSNKKQGLFKNARNPASIQNAEHHDPSGSSKSANGVPATIKQVVATSTTKTPLEDYAMVWAVNRDASVQYVFVGKDSSVPVAADASNSLAIPPNSGVLLNCGASDDDMQSMAIKSSNALVHLTILEV